MIWTQSLFGTMTTTAHGLQFILEPTDWSIWDLEQAQASAEYLAAQKAAGLNPWTPGATVRLFYRAAQVNGTVQIRNSKGGFQPRKRVAK